MFRVRYAKRTAAAFVAAALAVAFAIAVSAAAFGRIQAGMERTRTAVRASFALRAAFAALVDQETGMRGYVASGVPLFLEPYRSGHRAYAAYRADDHPALNDPLDQRTIARFARSGDALGPYFTAQVEAVARGDRRTAVGNLPAGKVAFDRLRRDEAAATAALDRSIFADRAATNVALAAGRIATAMTGLVLILTGGLIALLFGRARINADLARRDSLTRLPNRRAFEERLACELTQPPPLSLAVLYIDLDRYKPVNDELGHAAGDQVLALCADRLRAALRPEDFAARVGGDEFAAILRRSDATAARAVAGRIAADIAAPFAVAGTLVRLGASIGIALVPDDGQQAEVLVRAADAAMYRAKQTARAS